MAKNNVEGKKPASGSGPAKPAPAAGTVPKSAASGRTGEKGTAPKKPQGKTAPAKSSSAPRGRAASGAAAAAARGLKEVEKAVGTGAARIGRQTREIGGAVQARVEQDLVPLAGKATREFGKAQKTLGKFFRSTARATQKSARIVAIRSRISTRTREIRKLYESLGEQFYERQKKAAVGQDLVKQLGPIVREIEKIVAEIAKLETEERAVRKGS